MMVVPRQAVYTVWEVVQGCQPRWLPPCLCSSSPSPTLVVSFDMWILCFGGKCTVEVLHKRNKKENEKALENIVLCKMLMHKTVSIKQWIKDLKPEKSAESKKKLQKSCKWSIWSKYIAVVVREALAGWWWCARSSFLTPFSKVCFKDQRNCILNKECSVFCISVSDYLFCVLFVFFLRSWW